MRVGRNLTLGSALLLVSFAVFFLALYGGARLVGGGKAVRPPVATRAEPPDIDASPTISSATGETGLIEIAGRNIQFDKRSLSAPANTPITIRFNNQDAGVLHNFAIYTNRQATTKVFVGQLITGPRTIDYSFTSPAPGSYFYRCDVHPDQMTGTLTIR